jgi:phenylpropionate dioxygenase-like ring-hydroxylating dioxygenase large terminal subunit
MRYLQILFLSIIRQCVVLIPIISGYSFHLNSRSFRRQSSASPHLSSFKVFSSIGTQWEQQDFEFDNRIEETTSSTNFAKFDYLSHWYPVVWAKDAPAGVPTKVTLFDVDYVISQLSDGSFVCMEDRCPHKSAALSEGRMTAAGYFQCAYHGWSLDGKDGTCVEIPQLVTAAPTTTLTTQDRRSGNSIRTSIRTTGTARPCQLSQGMVWIFPGGSWVDAMRAPRPPTIPEYDQAEFRMCSEVIRDFPIDFSLLLENIMDPDHGLFAHGAKGFDLFSASTTSPMSIEERQSGPGWQITSRVAAVEKVLAVDRQLRGIPSKPKGKANTDRMLAATTVFYAPTTVFMSRRDIQTDETSFIVSFFVCPVGLGRSRFMSCSLTKAPVLPPRWLTHIFVNNFLDQDTHLLATQQKHVLQWEAQALKRYATENAQSYRSGGSINTMVRKKNFVYRSPTEKMGARIGAFWDATLSRVPNRVEKFMEDGIKFEIPPREVTLNREIQHVQICPDSQVAVKNCDVIRKLALWMPILAGVVTSTAALTKGIHVVGRILGHPIMRVMLISSFLAYRIATLIRREFFFKYTKYLRDRDLSNTPKAVWLDKM